jgi:phospho-N-acetylmuramoyl-pentapeptide-transferase
VIALLIAGAVSTIVSLIGTPILIRWLQANGIGQPIRDDGPQGHFVKAGTPTMGGVTIVAGAVAGYLAGHAEGQIFTWGAIAVLVAVVGAGLTGLLDDWIKVRHERSLGLNKRMKVAGQVVTAGLFCLVAIRYAHVKTNLSFTRWNALVSTPMPTWVWCVWAALSRWCRPQCPHGSGACGRRC